MFVASYIWKFKKMLNMSLCEGSVIQLMVILVDES